MRIIGTNFDIRDIEAADKSGFKQVMCQEETFRSLIDSAPESIDTLWGVFMGSSVAVVDKADTFVGFAHYEAEEEGGDGQFELVLLNSLNYTGFGKELLPEVLKYAFEQTGASVFEVEVSGPKNVSRAIYTELGYDCNKEKWIYIYRTGKNV